MAVALTMAGSLDFNPLADKLTAASAPLTTSRQSLSSHLLGEHPCGWKYAFVAHECFKQNSILSSLGSTRPTWRSRVCCCWPSTTWQTMSWSSIQVFDKEGNFKFQFCEVILLLTNWFRKYIRTWTCEFSWFQRASVTVECAQAGNWAPVGDLATPCCFMVGRRQRYTRCDGRQLCQSIGQNRRRQLKN